MFDLYCPVAIYLIIIYHWKNQYVYNHMLWFIWDPQFQGKELKNSILKVQTHTTIPDLRHFGWKNNRSQKTFQEETFIMWRSIFIWTTLKGQSLQIGSKEWFLEKCQTALASPTFQPHFWVKCSVQQKRKKYAKAERTIFGANFSLFKEAKPFPHKGYIMGFSTT